ncbi:hypothetical protein B0H15DRAFT_792830, partial [Mycena belliarum]
TCLKNATSTFEDLVACFDAYTVSEGYYSDETYTAAQPTDDQLRGWEDLTTSLLSVDGNCTSVVVPSSIAYVYDVSLFRDPEGPAFCIASESSSVDGVYAKGWGLLAVPATIAAVKRNIHLAAPHPAYDLFTPEQAGALFKSTGARSLLIAGRVRTAYMAPSDCVTSSTIYYKTDPAHEIAEPFFSASKAIRAWQHANGGCPAASCAFIQLHGKGARSCPSDTIFLSSGIGIPPGSLPRIRSPKPGRSAWYTDPAARPVKSLRAALAAAFPTWTVALPSDSACRLTATDNVFGRLVNGVPAQAVCTNASNAALTTGEFVHIEQAVVSRGSAAYLAWTAAIQAAFTPL